jgi:VanZ family protein
VGSVSNDFRYALHLLETWLIVVAVLWAGAVAVRARHGGIESAIRTSTAEAILAAGLVAIVSITVVPLAVYLPGQSPPPVVNVLPVIPLFSDLRADTGWTLLNIVGNLGLYVPLGIGLAWRFRLKAVWIAAIAASLSAIIEVWQAVSGSGRTSDINDVLLNTAGALVGATMVMFATRALGWYRQHSRHATTD